jgi:hypothetical protein
LELLNSQKSPNDIGAIVVLTAGINIRGVSWADKEQSAVEKARRLDIPVYAIRYITTQSTDIDRIASERTFGQTVDRNDNPSMRLIEFYQNMNKRHYGNDYQITFTPATTRNFFKPHRIELRVGNERIEPPLEPLVVSFSMWIKVKENLLLFIGLVVLLVALMAGLGWWLVSSHKKRKNEIANANANAASANATAATATAAAAAMAAEKKAAEEKEMAEAKRKEIEHFANLMHSKNWRPRLEYVIDGEKQTFPIQTPTTTIGRNSDDSVNDLNLDLPSVSRKHAVVTFINGAFEIRNLSQYGTYVNGSSVEQAVLKKGAKIRLNETNITFYW